jgi:hypothetical protein
MRKVLASTMGTQFVVLIIKHYGSDLSLNKIFVHFHIALVKFAFELLKTNKGTFYGTCIGIIYT